MFYVAHSLFAGLRALPFGKVSFYLVENHRYRASTKLGTTDRAALAALLRDNPWYGISVRCGRL